MINECLKKVVEQLPLIQQLFEHDIFLSVIDSDGVIQGFAVPNGVTPQLQIGELFVDPSGAF